AGQDPRLRVIHLAENAGPGPARMRGLAEAAGTYVWFVDPDDLLADGALAAVAAGLAGGEPDVLLIDYLILGSSGHTPPRPGAAAVPFWPRPAWTTSASSRPTSRCSPAWTPGPARPAAPASGPPCSAGRSSTTARCWRAGWCRAGRGGRSSAGWPPTTAATG